VPKGLLEKIKGASHPVLAVTIMLTEAIDEARDLLPQWVSLGPRPRSRRRPTPVCALAGALPAGAPYAATLAAWAATGLGLLQLKEARAFLSFAGACQLVPACLLSGGEPRVPVAVPVPAAACLQRAAAAACQAPLLFPCRGATPPAAARQPAQQPRARAGRRAAAPALRTEAALERPHAAPAALEREAARGT
jgi:hypothetical protein